MRIIFTIITLLSISFSSLASLRVRDLTCELLNNPIAIDNTTPHFAWKINSTEMGMSVSAYQVLVATSLENLDEQNADLWNSGKVNSCESVSVTYEGKPLSSRSYAVWKVRVWDQNGNASDWSAPASFGVGLLEEKDWNPEACFIGVKQNKKKTETAPLLRTKFHVSAGGQRYLLHVNSLGYHEAFVNGQPVSDGVLLTLWRSVSLYRKVRIVLKWM